MSDAKNSSGENKALKERKPRKNFDETQFIADAVLFFCKKSLDEIETAKRNEEMTAVCNLYSMINLRELRELAGFCCDFGLIDEYRDIILKKTEDSLHMMGVQTSSTYKFNPYMVCAFTAACADMDADELDRLGNAFTTKSEFKKTYISILTMILVNAVYQLALTMLRADAVKMPAFMSAEWTQLILASITVLGTAAALAYYFRRCTASFITEWKIRKRLFRGLKEKGSHAAI